MTTREIAWRNILDQRPVRWWERWVDSVACAFRGGMFHGETKGGR